MARLKVAVVGFGVMGKHHANVYAALPHTDLVAVVDPNAERRAVAAHTHAVDTYRDVAALLRQHTVDAVSVAAPTSLHYSICRCLLEAGVHVMVEKPVAPNVEQAQHLAELSRRLGLVLQVGHITRFYKAVQMLGEQVSQPYLIEARRLSPSARIQDVGVILDLMIHDIDIVLGLEPSDLRSITVSGHVLANNLHRQPHEDVAAAQIVFESGCIARFLASRVAPDAERTLVVAEADKTIRLDFGKEPHTEIAVYRTSPDATTTNGTSTNVQMQRTDVFEDNPLRKELEHFLDRIRYRTPPIGTLDDDLRSLRLATRLIDDLKTQAIVPTV